MTPAVMRVTGLSEREIGYMIRQGHAVVDAPGPGNPRRWSALAIAQAALYSMVKDQMEHRVAFAACRALTTLCAPNDITPIVGLWMVADRNGQVTLTRNVPDHLSETVSVLSLDLVVEKVALVFAGTT